MTLTTGEVDFFNTIKSNCNIVFDIGCREDTEYLLLHPSAEYHLFEPNPSFFENLKFKLDLSNKSIHANNFGLGKETEIIQYYPDSQSFIKRTVDFQSDEKLCINLPIKNFSEYILEKDIKHIDFMKIDTEGNEPDILFFNVDFIKENVDFLQFEYASTWIDRNDYYRIQDVYNQYNDKFLFFVVYNFDHPFSKIYGKVLTEVLTKEDLNLLDRYMYNSYGFNIAMINKEKIQNG